MLNSRLAPSLAEGRGVKKDLTRAADLFEKAATNGHSSAQYNLALLYLDGKGRPADEQKAVEWMQKAAEQGNAPAEYDLAPLPIRPRRRRSTRRRPRNGPGAPPKRVLPEAQVEYGVMLFKGEGVVRRRGIAPPSSFACPRTKVTRSPRTGSRASTPMARW